MNKSILRLLFLSILFQNCMETNTKNNPDNVRLYSANDISTYQDQIIIATTAVPAQNVIDVKFPYLMVLDDSLNVSNSKIFDSQTTASNVCIETLSEGNCILTYYCPKSLQQLEEKTVIKKLDHNLEELNGISYGHRTRIKNIVSTDSTVVALNYERSTKDVSIVTFSDFKEKSKTKFKEDSETTMPTDIILLPDNTMVVSGIANGFHYLDGHNYENAFSYGFAKKLGSDGRDLKNYYHRTSGHVFFNEVIYDSSGLTVVGTKQSNRTGMDILFLRLDEQLNLVWEKVFEAPGIQEGNKIISIDGYYYLLGTTENLETHKMQGCLVKANSTGKIIWKQDFGIPEASHTTVDMIYHNSGLVVLSESKEARNSNPSVQLYKISTEGEMMRELSLN